MTLVWVSVAKRDREKVAANEDVQCNFYKHIDKMMSESEENIEISHSPIAANPFDEPEKEEETEPTTPASTNPFEMEDVEETLPQNPFDQDERHEVDGTKADYEYVSLVTPAVEVGKAHNRDWDLEWDHVSNAVKKNFSSVSVVAPEVISSMMSK